MNPVAEVLTGWTFAQAENQPVEDIFHIVDALTGETMVNPVNRVLESGNIVSLANHTKLISKNSKEYQISIPDRRSGMYRPNNGCGAGFQR